VFIIAPIIRIIVVVGAACAKILIVIHFGINPVSGGNPLKDSRRRGIINWYGFENEIILLALFLLVLFLMWRMMKIGQIISE